jgi:zinc transporter 9
VYHGVNELFNPTPLDSLGVALAVLGIAFLVEGGTFLFALRQVRRAASKIQMSLRDYIFHGPDPMGVAVLIEDGAAVVGVAIAASCIGMTYWTGNAIWDGIGSLGVGGWSLLIPPDSFYLS